MNILAIDTSTEVASVALMSNNDVLSAQQDNIRTHARFILPMIDRLMAETGLQFHQLDKVVFGCGPGSFTGLRIACSVVKGIAYAHDLGLVPVSTLGAIAYSARAQTESMSTPVLAVLDARMQEMYWGFYLDHQYLSNEQVSPVSNITVPLDQPLLLAGVGIELYWSMFPETIKSKVYKQLAVFPDAADMIRLSLEAQIKPVSVSEAQPVYVRNQVTQGGSRG